MLGFIVNPVSGNGRGAAVWMQLRRELERQGRPYCAYLTTEEGEARKLAVRMLQKEEVTRLVAVGGDGTVNEVMNGIYESGKDCLFGHIAAGSGNDFARGHQLPLDPVQALERVLSEKQQNCWIDLLQFNGRIAVNAVGAGFDGQVAKTTNESFYKKWLNKWKIGMLSYVVSVVRVLFSYKPCEVSITVDGKTEILPRVWFIALSNIPNYGGGMLICPHAVADDGIAEVCVVSSVSRWSLLRAFPLIFSGSHVNHPAVRFYRGEQIQIQSEKPLVVHADGEVVAATPITVNVLKRRQNVIK
jgi:diacylglycerol kinase (ATP)